MVLLPCPVAVSLLGEIDASVLRAEASHLQTIMTLLAIGRTVFNPPKTYGAVATFHRAA
jgi:hypothetical protein